MRFVHLTEATIQGVVDFLSILSMRFDLHHSPWRWSLPMLWVTTFNSLYEIQSGDDSAFLHSAGKSLSILSMRFLGKIWRRCWENERKLSILSMRFWRSQYVSRRQAVTHTFNTLYEIHWEIISVESSTVLELSILSMRFDGLGGKM